MNIPVDRIGFSTDLDRSKSSNECDEMVRNKKSSGWHVNQWNGFL